jgi:hypothetical protein
LNTSTIGILIATRILRRLRHSISATMAKSSDLSTGAEDSSRMETMQDDNHNRSTTGSPLESDNLTAKAHAGIRPGNNSGVDSEHLYMKMKTPPPAKNANPGLLSMLLGKTPAKQSQEPSSGNNQNVVEG